MSMLHVAARTNTIMSMSMDDAMMCPCGHVRIRAPTTLGLPTTYEANLGGVPAGLAHLRIRAILPSGTPDPDHEAPKASSTDTSQFVPGTPTGQGIPPPSSPPGAPVKCIVTIGVKGGHCNAR